jgi:WD40 repeat protein
MPGEKDLYLLRNLPGHLHRAEEQARLRDLLSSYTFLAGKVHSQLVPDLVSDYDLLPEDSPLRFVQRAIRLAAHVLGSEPEQLAGQLCGRLLHKRDEAEIAALLDAAREQPARGLVPTTASLAQVGGALLQTLPGYRSAIEAIALTRDGERLVSGSFDRTVRIWSLATGRELRTLRGHGARVTAVGLTLDGRSVISGSEDRTLRIWNVDSGLQEAEIPTANGVKVLTVAPHGGQVVAGLADGSIQVVDLPTGAVKPLAGHTRSISGLAFTPDGRHLVSASEDGTLGIWDLADGSAERFDGQAGPLRAMAMAVGGDRVFYDAQGCTIAVWSLVERRQIATLEGHRSGVRALAVSRNGKHLVSLAGDNTLRVWDLAENRQLSVIPVRSTGPLVLTPDGNRALIGLRVWALPPEETPALIEPADGTRALAMVPGGPFVISASSDRTLKIWDTLSGREIRTLTGHTQTVWAVAVTPDGRHAVSGSADKTLKVWDLQTGEATRTIAGHASNVMAVALTADGKRVISGGIHSEIKVWSLEDGREIYSHRLPKGYLIVLAATPAGRLAVVGFNDEGTEWPFILDTKTGHVVGQLRGHEAAVESVLFTQRGRRVLTGSYDTTVRLWDLASRRELRRLEGHQDRVGGLAVTPDGRYAASASDDATLKVWRLETGECLATFTGDGALGACAISPDASLLVAGESFGKLHFFRMRS